MAVCRVEGDGGGDSVWSDQWGIPLWSVCPSVLDVTRSLPVESRG